MTRNKKIIIKVVPSSFPVGKNQNVSIWTVAKSAIENSKFANNFIIISPTPQNETVNCLPNICYIPSSKKVSTSDHNIENWNLYTNVSFTEYLEGIKKQINKLNPALIEVENDIKLASNIAKAFPAIPVIFIPHVVIGKRHFLTRIIQYWKQLRPIKEFIFVSNGHKNQFFKNFFYSKKPYTVIHNSYAHLPKTNIDLKNKINNIIYAGRATKDKGYEEFILGVIPVLHKHSDWTATAVLSVETKENKLKLQSFINQTQIQSAIKENRLQILTNVPNLELFKLFEKAKIAVFPTHTSWFEGLPLVGIESHFTKCAVITSPNAGFKELSGDNIFYLDSITPNDVTTKIEHLISNPEKLENLALSGYNNLIKNYNIANLVKKYDAIREKYL